MRWLHACLGLALGFRDFQAGIVDAVGDDRPAVIPAGLAELMPWVRQWHDEVDPTYGVNMADFCVEQLRDRAAQVGQTLVQLHAWRPATPTRGRRPKGA